MNATRYRCLGFIAAALPALLPLWLILHDGVDTHFWDEWDPDWAGMYIRAHNHQLKFSELFKQHNEHRMVVSRLISLILNHFDQWNNIHLLIVGWIAVCITSLGFLALCRQTARETSIFRWFLCNLLLFSPVQIQNWLWGAGPPYFLAPMFIILAFVIIGSNFRDSAKVLSCILLGTAAIFSNGNGALSLPLCGLLLVWRGSWQEMKSRLRIAAILVLACGILAGLYLIHFKQPDFNGASGYGGSLRDMAVYFLTFLGNPFGGVVAAKMAILMSQICGAAMLAIFCLSIGYFFIAWSKNEEDVCRRMLPWIAVGTFAICSAILATHARSKFGPQQAMESRYVTSSLYLPIALVNLIYLICGKLAEIRKPARAVAATGIILLQLLCIPAALADGEQWRASQRDAKAAILLVNILPDNPDLQNIFPVPKILIDLANQANQIGYIHPRLIDTDNADLLRSEDAGETNRARGALEGYRVDKNGNCVLVGWAISPENSEPADAVVITCKDKYQRPMICSLADLGFRKDKIVEQEGNSRYKHCGFEATISPAHLPPGASPLIFQAWALDTDAARAIPLEGAVTLRR
jgi:hypothetical protein